jgi:hypothetical protein
MIDLGRPAFHARGVTFFADHASERTLHYLPDRPRLRPREDGSPELSLLKYRLDPALHGQLGGGVLALTTDLFVDETLLAELRPKAARAIGLPSASDVQFAPVAADEGACELILLDRATRDEQPAPASTSPETPPADGPASDLVERLLGATQPALFGHNAATFFATLSPEGATLVERAIREGGLPIGVVYALKTTGLRPALSAEITARWHDVYKFLDDRFHGGKLLLAVDIGPTVERLVHDELISIKVDELVPADERPGVYQQALDQAQRYVMEELFKPTLGQAPPAEDESADALATIGRAIKDIFGVFSFTFSLRDVKRDELKTFTYRLQAARAERLTLAPQGTLSILLPEGMDRSTIDRLITEIAPGPPSELRCEVMTAADLAREGVSRIEVNLTYAGQIKALEISPTQLSQAATFSFSAAAGNAVGVGYTVHLVPGEGVAGPLVHPGFTTDHRTIVLTPTDLYQNVAMQFVTMGVPFDRYAGVLVDLQLHDLASDWRSDATLRLDKEQPEAKYVARLDRGARLIVRRKLRYVDTQGQEIVVDWDDVDPGVVVIGDPLPSRIDLPILGSARFGSVVRRLIVELKPGSDPSHVDTRILTAEEPAATWSWSAPSDGNRGYEYRVTVHTVLNEVREGQWLAGPAGRLIVGEGIARLRQVELFFTGKTLAEAGLLAAKVRFSHQGSDLTGFDEHEALVQDFAQSVKWTYPVAADSELPYSYQVTFIKRDGTREDRPPVTTADLLAIIPVA